MKKDGVSLTSVANDPVRLIQYLKDKGANHNNYKYYSTIEKVERLIEEQVIYLTRGDGWNDLKDDMGFSGSRKGYVRFGKCFSFSRSENVAMWMLYGGTKKEGAMLDLTKSQAATILNTDDFELGYFDKGFEYVKRLAKTGNCSLFFTDILYCDESDGSCTVKRSDERVDGLEKLPEGDGLLTKSYPWSYENEVRLVFEAPIDQVPENADCVRIPLNIEKAALKSRVYSAPNSTVRGYNRSRLKSSISWNICRGCDRAAEQK